MGKPTGFIEWERLLPRKRPVAERLGDYREFGGEHSVAESRRQAGRCMDCGVPFCQQGCPLGNPIPDFNELVYQGSFEAAHRWLSATNDFPEFTGRLCPAPCEAACTLAINAAPVTIEQIEKEIIERAFREGWVVPRPPRVRSGKSAAVVGSGPAGLAAAAQLNRAGHRVGVYEKSDRVGGLLRYGIPDFKMESSVIDRRIALRQAEGVEFFTGVDVGGARPLGDLLASHDAVLLAVGSRRPRDLDVPGRDLAGVMFAMDYLEQQNRRVAGDDLAKQVALDADGKRVIILGGGDTGSDCLGTAHRQGAREVRQIELMPLPPGERGAGNPWPQWPLVFRTSSSQEEGGERSFALQTTRLEGVSGALTSLHACGVEARGGKLVPIAGSETRFDVDQLILALGFVGPDTSPWCDELGILLDARGNLATRGYATSVPRVFAAGDARRGQSLIVWAIAEGREAARAIDAELSGRASALPACGADCHFGGR